MTPNAMQAPPKQHGGEEEEGCDAPVHGTCLLPDSTGNNIETYDF